MTEQEITSLAREYVGLMDADKTGKLARKHIEGITFDLGKDVAERVSARAAELIARGA